MKPLAIAYSVKRRQKSAPESLVQSVDRLPNHENDHDGILPHSEEPTHEVEPAMSDRPRGMMGADASEIAKAVRAKRMAFGGMLGDDSDRALAMNDTYPTEDHEESDTMAQDMDETESPAEGFNTTGDEAEHGAEMKASRTLRAVRMAMGMK